MNDLARATRRSEKQPGLRERMRAAIRAEVTEVAIGLFTLQGFEHTTADEIAAAAGLSRASLFRYFGTKEDIVLASLEGDGQTVVEALMLRPADEQPWVAMRRSFDALVHVNEQSPERALVLLRLLHESPQLRARHIEKQLSWQTQLDPEIARRLQVAPRPDDPRPSALVAAALACLDASARAWVASGGRASLASMLDRAMGVVGEPLMSSFGERT